MVAVAVVATTEVLVARTTNISLFILLHFRPVIVSISQGVMLDDPSHITYDKAIYNLRSVYQYSMCIKRKSLNYTWI